jgi:hypothetical protein
VPKALNVRFEGGLQFGGNGIEVSSVRCYCAGAKGLDVLLGGHYAVLGTMPYERANRNTGICVELMSSRRCPLPYASCAKPGMGRVLPFSVGRLRCTAGAEFCAFVIEKWGWQDP